MNILDMGKVIPIPAGPRPGPKMTGPAHFWSRCSVSIETQKQEFNQLIKIVDNAAKMLSISNQPTHIILLIFLHLNTILPTYYSPFIRRTSQMQILDIIHRIAKP
jgi:hypothetical protein